MLNKYIYDFSYFWTLSRIILFSHFGLKLLFPNLCKILIKFSLGGENHNEEGGWRAKLSCFYRVLPNCFSKCQMIFEKIKCIKEKSNCQASAKLSQLKSARLKTFADQEPVERLIPLGQEVSPHSNSSVVSVLSSSFSLSGGTFHLNYS